MSTDTTIYNISHELLGDCAPATADEIAQIVREWNDEDWTYHANECGELRIYAVRNQGSETVGVPMRSVYWHETSSDNEFFIVVGEIENAS